MMKTPIFRVNVSIDINADISNDDAVMVGEVVMMSIEDALAREDYDEACSLIKAHHMRIQRLRRQPDYDFEGSGETDDGS
jgi:hypothetical protein